MLFNREVWGRKMLPDGQSTLIAGARSQRSLAPTKCVFDAST